MYSKVCNVKEFCYVVPAVINNIEKINVICEGFMISVTHDASTSILKSLFNIFSFRTKDDILELFID